MDDFLFNLQYKQVRFQRKGYLEINLTNIIVLGFLMPIFCLATICLMIWAIIIKEYLSFVFALVFIFPWFFVFIPFRLYNKLPDYFRVRKIEKLVTNNNTTEMIHLIREDNKSSVLAAYFLKDLNDNSINSDLIEILVKTEYRLLENLIVDYLKEVNSEITVRVVDILRNITDFTKRYQLIKILMNHKKITRHVDIDSLLESLLRNNLDDISPIEITILEFYTKQTSDIIKKFDELYEPKKELPKTVIDFSRNTESNEAKKFLQRIINTTEITSVKDQASIALEILLSNLKSDLRHTSLIRKQLSKFDSLKKGLLDEIKDSKVNKEILMKINELTELFNNEKIRLDALTSFKSDIYDIIVLTKEILNFKQTILHDLPFLLKVGENQSVEFKYSITTPKTLNRCVESVAAFANTNDGLVIIGVDNSQNPSGIELDLEIFNTDNPKDDFKQKIINQLMKKFRKVELAFVKIFIIAYQNVELCCIKVDKSDDPIFIDEREFWVRVHNRNAKLTPNEMLKYTKKI